MAAPVRRSAADLFDNPAFSDVTILQFDGYEELHEYRAHKAVLCMESGFFREAFTEDYREKDSIKIKGDDNLHFELLLKYIYTNHYDTDEIAKLADKDSIERILIPMGICVVATKYMVPAIYEMTSEDVRMLLSTQETDTYTLLRVAIAAHYVQGSKADTPMGKLIVSVILEGQCKFTESVSYEGTLKAYPTFAVDMALVLARNITHRRCPSCSNDFTFRSRIRKEKKQTSVFCSLCKTAVRCVAA
ncbi:hypothetical protein EKO04_009229 [Ascochyta lentis]|uniref:BTB domain-containing protein n=1 Tax=Ascochyta lentis TaxID=205686 RepID=A0A8H7IZB3_9PLEO|nr:hypothetical protein EKO04_009229 [Ascochyta lentis]